MLLAETFLLIRMEGKAGTVEYQHVTSVHSSYWEQVKDPRRVSKATGNGLGSCGVWGQGLKTENKVLWNLKLFSLY